MERNESASGHINRHIIVECPGLHHPPIVRYVRTVLIPTDRPLHPFDQRLAEADDVTRKRLYHLNLLDDGTAISLYEMTGNADRVRDLAEDADFYDSQISTDRETVTLYAHFDPSDVMVELLSLFREHELILDLPLEYTERGGLRAMVIGEMATIREVMPKLPDDLAVKLEQTGEYEPDSDVAFAALTQRQQEILLTALELGYYEFPRQATQEDIADELDRTVATIGEHLRRIESTVLSTVAPR